jgi:hypothetical protein
MSLSMNTVALTLESEKALAQELDAICASGAFRHSPQQQRLLRPAFDRLRSRPEFSAILHGVGLPELHFTH